MFNQIYIGGSDKIKIFERLTLSVKNSYVSIYCSKKHRQAAVINFYWIFLREVSGKVEFRTW